MVTFNPAGPTLPELDDWHLETQLLFSCLHFGGCKRWVVPVLFKSHEDPMSILEALLKLLVKYLVNDGTFRLADLGQAGQWIVVFGQFQAELEQGVGWIFATYHGVSPWWGCHWGLNFHRWGSMCHWQFCFRRSWEQAPPIAKLPLSHIPSALGSLADCYRQYCDQWYVVDHLNDLEPKRALWLPTCPTSQQNAWLFRSGLQSWLSATSSKVGWSHFSSPNSAGWWFGTGLWCFRIYWEEFIIADRFIFFQRGRPNHQPI